MQVIQHQELASAQSSIEFTSIPQTFTDLVILTSFRSAGTNANDSYIQFNGDTGSNYSFRRLYGEGSGSGQTDTVSGAATAGRVSRVVGSSYTSNTFSNSTIYIPNYRIATAKSLTVDTVEENNATLAYQMIYATRWSGTAAITSLKLQILGGDNFAQYSSATLYGITAGSSGGVVVS
jgi:hypothetical protein